MQKELGEDIRVGSPYKSLSRNRVGTATWSTVASLSFFIDFSLTLGRMISEGLASHSYAMLVATTATILWQTFLLGSHDSHSGGLD